MFISPMLLEKRESPFDDDRYIFEPKIDGHRMIMSIQDGAVRLYTRHENEVTRQYPELHDVPIANSSDAVLDGEVAIVDPESGAVEFESIMERFRMSRPMSIREASVRRPVHYFVFDILRYKGQDVRSKPLTERRALLDDVLQNNRYFSRTLAVDGAGRKLFEAIKDKDMEGIVAKRKDSTYVSQRSPKWLKIINYQYATVRIAGYRKNQFGWLAQLDGRGVGIIELAVPAVHRQAFYGIAKTIVTGEDRNYVYLEPSIQAVVQFRNWTRAGLLRSPEFVRFIV
ncbi:RNA ligase family protein [Cohnella algarum]|uniref:ATP-dependent DNA ligase n=1 Tax=Cohnella algarum TaxID=2044859 RepID=UPI0019676029|nr:RNA ligase family protein [Cohnella algarum]MBN2980095.1 ATP-dependent DNA ligase [Cohnella algarum]